MIEPYITLREAMESGRLDAFAAQEEARGVGQVDKAELERTLAKVIKAPRSKGQTSHSPLRDGSTGKQTRRGNGRHISR